MTLVRVTVAGTIGKAVRINTDATIGSQIGVDFQLPDGTVPTIAELAEALYIESPPGEFVSDTESSAGPQIFESQVIDGLLLARVADNEVITGAYRFDNTLTMGNSVPINWRDSDSVPVEIAILEGGAVGDPDNASVVLLADVENTDGEGDQAFVVNVGGHTLTATEASTGIAEVRGAQAKFGLFSIYAEDAAGAVKARWGTTVNSTDFDFGSGDWTMECHLLFDTLSGASIPLFAKWKFNDFSFKAQFDSGGENFTFQWSTNGTSVAGGTVIAWPVDTYNLDQWYHMAIAREGNTVRFFVDGVLCGTQQDVTGVTFFTGSTEFELFSSDSNGAGAHKSYMDNVRITKGVARYTTTFTPPTVAFPTTAGSTAEFTLGDPLVDMYLDANEIRIRGVTTTNYLAIDHDDTDFNIVGVNTVDINITGITSIQAGTVDVDFDAITATSYGGILEANLVDKTAQEEITTFWTWNSTQPKIRFNQTDAAANNRLWEIGVDNEQFVLSLWNDAQSAVVDVFSVDRTLNVVDSIDFLVGTAGKFTVQEGSTIKFEVDHNAKVVFIHDGWALKIEDTASVGNVSFVHNGTDFKAIFTSTTDWDITGITAFNTGAAITAISYGGILEANLLDKTATEDITGSWTFSVGPTFFSAGTEGAPGIAFDGDPDTGAYSPGANIYAITVAGTEAVRYIGASVPLIQYGMVTGITASTTQTQGEGALHASHNEVSVVANNDDTVTLPPALPGCVLILINNGTKRLQVFPASGDDLGVGVDQPDTIKANASIFYVSYDGTNWFDIATKFSGLLDTDIIGVSANDILFYNGSSYTHTGGKLTWNGTLLDITGNLQVSGDVGFYGTTAIAQQTGVAVSAAGIHAALVNLGLITA